MLGEEHYIVLLSSSSAILQWHCRAHGWYAQDYSSSHAQTSTSRKRMVVICLPICRTYDERENSSREWPHPLFGQLVGRWKSRDKAQAKSLGDRGSIGYLLDIWQSGTTCITQDGVVVKGWHWGIQWQCSNTAYGPEWIRDSMENPSHQC